MNFGILTDYLNNNNKNSYRYSKKYYFFTF